MVQYFDDRMRKNALEMLYDNEIEELFILSINI